MIPEPHCVVPFAGACGRSMCRAKGTIFAVRLILSISRLVARLWSIPSASCAWAVLLTIVVAHDESRLCHSRVSALSIVPSSFALNAGWQDFAAFERAHGEIFKARSLYKRCVTAGCAFECRLSLASG